jgi:CubicO group peptidase (beta-lactamase class C family)
MATLVAVAAATRDCRTMTRWLFAAALAAFLGVACGPATRAPQAAAGSELTARLDRIAAERLAGAPGATVRVEYRGEVVLDRAYGEADLELGTPMTTDAVMGIGSISKQFLAAAVMQQVEVGVLSLDTPLARFHPAFPRAYRITIDDLLHHTSGIADFEYVGTWPTTMAVARTSDEVIATFADLPAEFEPGTRWAYSSSNYVLLGTIVEQLGGTSLAEYLAERVFAPAGLTATRFCDADELIPRRAHGYRRVAGPDGKPRHAPAEPALLVQFGAAGGLCSTTADMVRWQRALAGGRVVSAASYARMITALPLTDGRPTGYGYGLFVGDFAGHPVIAHDGGVSGYGAELSFYPDDDLHIAALYNSREAPFVGRDLATAVLAVPAPEPVPLETGAAARYAIRFVLVLGSGDDLTFPVEVTADGDRLVLHVFGETEPLVHLGGGRFVDARRRIALAFEEHDGKVVDVTVDLGNLRMHVEPAP